MNQPSSPVASSPLNGINGVSIEALIAVGADRLKDFQCGDYACDDNEEALEHLRSAMACLLRRTQDRVERGVEGKHQP